MELTVKEDEQPKLAYSPIEIIDYKQVRIGSQSQSAWADDEYSSAIIFIKNTASTSFLTKVPLTVRLNTQNPQFKMRINETKPFTQTLSVSLLNEESIDVFIQFAPQIEGLITTTIQIQSNDLNPKDNQDIHLTGKGVPDTDGDGEMDYNDNPDLDDKDSDNDGLSDDLEGGDDPENSNAFRTIDSDGNGISDPMERSMPGMNYSINFQPVEINAPDGWYEDQLRVFAPKSPKNPPI